MKILCVGDMHMRYQHSYAGALEDGRKGEWEKVKNKIVESSKECDIIVLLGDILNTKHNHSSVNKELVEFLQRFEDKQVFMISGNHCRFGNETALDFLQKMNNPKWMVYTKPSTINHGGLKLSFLPYMTPGSLGVKDLDEANKKVHEMLEGGDILFHHHAVSGAVFSGTTSEMLNEIVLQRETLEKKYKWIIGGHIHKPQKISQQTIVAGNIFTQEIGEHTKSIWMLDTDTKEIIRIPLPTRGIYSIEWKDKEDLVNIPLTSIVKCVIKNRDVDVDKVEKMLSRFDAYIIVLQYPNERTKLNAEDTGKLDLSIDNLLKVYCNVKDISYQNIKDAMELI